MPSQPTAFPASSSALPYPLPGCCCRCSFAAFISERPASFCSAPESFHAALPVTLPICSCYSSVSRLTFLVNLARESSYGLQDIIWKYIWVDEMKQMTLTTAAPLANCAWPDTRPGSCWLDIFEPLCCSFGREIFPLAVLQRESAENMGYRTRMMRGNWNVNEVHQTWREALMTSVTNELLQG